MEANGDLGVALEKHKRQRDAYVQIKHELNINVLNHDEDIPEALRIPTRMDRLNKINTLSTSQRVSIAIAAMYLKDNQWNVQTAADMLCGHRASHSEIRKRTIVKEVLISAWCVMIHLTIMKKGELNSAKIINVVGMTVCAVIVRKNLQKRVLLKLPNVQCVEEPMFTNIGGSRIPIT